MDTSARINEKKNRIRRHHLKKNAGRIYNKRIKICPECGGEIESGLCQCACKVKLL